MGTSRFTETKGHSESQVRCGFTLRQKEYMKCFSQTKRYIPEVSLSDQGAHLPLKVKRLCSKQVTYGTS